MSMVYSAHFPINRRLCERIQSLSRALATKAHKSSSVWKNNDVQQMFGFVSQKIYQPAT